MTGGLPLSFRERPLHPSTAAKDGERLPNRHRSTMLGLGLVFAGSSMSRLC
jgi:hypothetical protein